ncbi:MAG: 3-phosphoshikimate 1-carboxyvinyltransferase [Chloroflexi bacterium]|nr:3-phosphoshikimate 1-carboxyvinyltransferase [Chloroflexota bacterium]
MRERVTAPARLEATVSPPGDKSISHRAVLLNSIALGTATVTNLCVGDDRASMLRCLRGLGASIEREADPGGNEANDRFIIRGSSMDGLAEPHETLNAGNSGTTMRLVSGLLAGQPYFSVITGDRSLRSRPMGRIVKPLREMGARVMGRSEDSLAPLAIRGGDLHGIEYDMPVASAQVKSCLLIAGLHAQGKTVIRQPAATRDHTERMLERMGGDITEDGLTITVRPGRTLSATDVRVPGDISSAAYWLVAAACHPSARVTVLNTGINPTRGGILEVLRAMGAKVTVTHVRSEGGEEAADITVESSDLVATEVAGELLPRLIDEVPVIALAACFARGETVVRDAQELRGKESDRIRTTVQGLSRLGADIRETPDGMVIRGTGGLRGAAVGSHGDHRLAMTLGVAGLLATGETVVRGAEAARVSYPNFWDDLRAVAGEHREA